MKPRFIVIALPFFIVVTLTASKSGALTNQWGLVGSGPHQETAPEAAPLARQKNRRDTIGYDEEVEEEALAKPG